MKTAWPTLALMLALLPGVAAAKLPDPTPEQTEAAAKKKADTDAQAAKDKEALSTSMDEVTRRWRKNAAEKGWKTHPPVAEKSAPAASGSQGSAPQGNASPPIKSEKAGTAPPSKDVKIPESQRPK